MKASSTRFNTKDEIEHGDLVALKWVSDRTPYIVGRKDLFIYLRTEHTVSFMNYLVLGLDGKIVRVGGLETKLFLIQKPNAAVAELVDALDLGSSG